VTSLPNISQVSFENNCRNASGLHVKYLLFYPILTKISLDGQLKSKFLQIKLRQNLFRGSEFLICTDGRGERFSLTLCRDASASQKRSEFHYYIKLILGTK